MALILDATLAAAQESASRHPLVEILSLQAGEDIPFDGTFLTTATYDESAPAIFAHSSGRLVAAYAYFDGSAWSIKYVWTDEPRQTFSFQTIAETGLGFTITTLRGISLVELDSGDVGIVWMLDEGTSNYHLRRCTVPVAGGTATRSTIASWALANQWTSDPWCVKLGTGSYAIYYVRKVAADGHYHFWNRDSSDFATWGAETETGPAYPGGFDAFDRASNPSLLKVSGGDLFLLFDLLEDSGPNGEELTNVYYSKSSNNGAAWDTAVKLTDFDTFGQVGEHPTGLQKMATSLHVLFTMKAMALNMDDSTAGWPPNTVSGVPLDMTFDPANRKLYVVLANDYAFRYVQGVVKIDVDTWTVDKYWNTGTVPALDENLTGVSPRVYSAFPYIVVANTLSAFGPPVLSVINADDETIRHYYFDDYPSEGIVSNVTSSPLDSSFFCTAMYVEPTAGRLYIAAFREASTVGYMQIGYLDLTETTAPYEFHVLVPTETGTINALIAISGDQYLTVFPSEDILCFSGSIDGGDWGGGFLRIYSVSTGALIKAFNYNTQPTFPRTGVRQCYLYGGRLWAGFTYYALYGQEVQRGLIEIDYISEAIQFHRPTFASVDEYSLYHVTAGPAGKLLVSSTTYGVCLFDVASSAWERFCNATVPGLTPNGQDHFRRAYYDESGLQIFGLSGTWPRTGWWGVVAFSQYGAYRQSQYMLGTLAGGSWSFSMAAALTLGYHDHSAVGVPDPADASSMYVFWENINAAGTETSVKWDKDASSLNLASYLVAGTDVICKRSIDGRPGSLAFTVSHGHLFDPYNQGSLFSLYLRKGRRLVVRWGEEVSGSPYWQNGGTFYITGASFSFERDRYPVVEVEAEDRRALWANHHIYATEAYDDLPIDILEGLMQNQAGFGAGELDFPAAFDNQVTLLHQWVDTTLDEIVNQICNRFGYHFRLTVDNKASARRISDVNAVDHAYTDLTKIIRFAPDDKYSDFTNRVTVQGQERSFTDVLFPEERVGALNGTAGWWGYRNDFEIYYSDDKERTCRNPRLVALETASSIGFQLAGGVSESISYEDPYEKYCVVTVSAQDLTPLLITLLTAEFAAMFWNPDPVQVGPSGSGFTIPTATAVRNVLLFMILMILASTGNFQYEIWAQPTGKIRRSIQSTANDTDHQAEIALVVEKKIEDPLCYSVPDCAVVAAFELMVARLQRRRVSIEKVAHLQDEEGDTISFPHPYSGQTVKMLVTDLTRTFVVPEPGSNDAGFFDTVEGWVINQ